MNLDQIHDLARTEQRAFVLDVSQTKKLQQRRKSRSSGMLLGDTIAAIGNTFAPGLRTRPELRRSQSASTSGIQEADDRIDLLWASGLTAISMNLSAGKTQVSLPKGQTLQYASVYKTTNSMLGEGSFGQVHPAQHISSKTDCVVKVVEKTAVGQDYLDEHQARDTFDLLLQLRHPNVVDYLDFMMSPRTVYVVMENLQGGELMDVLANTTNVTMSFCRNVMKSLLAALDYIHSRDVIHRDVKVNALRFRGSDEAAISSGPVLYDFGHCCRASTEEKAIVGTATYMAPEVARVYGISQKAAFDSKVDLWAAGVIFYVLLVGDFPWKLEGPRVVHQKELRLALDALQSVPEKVRTLCTQLLEREPEKRLSASNALGTAWLLDQTSDDTSLKVKQSTFMVAKAVGRFKKALNHHEAEEVSAWVFLPSHDFCGFKSFAIVGCGLCLLLLAYTFSLTFKLKPRVS